MPFGNLYIGTSGWSYPDWRGRFYPTALRIKDHFAYYRKHFSAVEINLSFYRLPTQNTLDAWNRELEPDFHLVLKGSRVITHMKKLKHCEEPLKRFWERAGQLKTLKAVLWQLPPNLHKDTDRLDHFLGSQPQTIRHAVEFRHDSWWDDEVAAVLARHRAAFVAVSATGTPAAIYPTADFLYVRFHGLQNTPTPVNYSRNDLMYWVERLTPYVKRGLTLYAFFNNDYHAYAVRNALRFRDLLQERLTSAHG